MTKTSFTPTLFALSACFIALGGCSPGTAPVGSGQPSFPAPTTAASTTAYVGISNPGYDSLILDDLQEQFIVQPQTYPAPAAGGRFIDTGGVLNFGNAAGTQRGLAVEQPGNAVALRPGDNSAYPVVLISQADCFAITGRQQYLYLTLSPHAAFGINDSAALVASYGTFTASTSADGKSWTIGDNHGYALPFIGISSSSPTENGSDPLSYSATCSSSNGIGTVTSDPAANFIPFQNDTPTNPTFHFHPGGLFLEDRSPLAPTASGRNSLYAQAGMAVPNDPVSLTDLGQGSYRGLVYEFDPNSTDRTHPVSLAPIAAGSSTLLGGLYPQDDLTQPAGTQYAIVLGKQDPVLHGLFASAQLSVLDPNGVCPAVAQGFGFAFKPAFDGQGNPVCLAAGVAIASKIQGKYVVYFTSYDATHSGASNVTQLIQFYLYQQ